MVAQHWVAICSTLDKTLESAPKPFPKRALPQRRKLPHLRVKSERQGIRRNVTPSFLAIMTIKKNEKHNFLLLNRIKEIYFRKIYLKQKIKSSKAGHTKKYLKA